MKRYILLCLLVAHCLGISAKTLHRSIYWDASSFNLNFSGGVLNDQGVPIYLESLSLSKNETFKITNPVFVACDEKYSSLMASVPTTFQVNPKVINSLTHRTGWIEFVPLINDGGQLKKLTSFTIETYSEEESSLKQIRTDSLWKPSSVLANGKWVKIRTSQKGIHKIPFSQLDAWGFSEPSKVNLYGNGGYMLPKMNDDFYYDDLMQNAVWYGKGSENEDCLFFYSTGTVKWTFDTTQGIFRQALNDYSDYTYFYLSDVGDVKVLEGISQPTGQVTNTLSTFQDYEFLEEEKDNLLKSGRRWFGDKFSKSQQRNYSFTINNLANGEPLKLSAEVAARSSEASSFILSYNGANVGTINCAKVNVDEETSLYASTANKLSEIADPGSAFSIGVKFLAANSSAQGWLDYLTLNFRRNLVLDGSQLAFRDRESIGPGNISQFNLSVQKSNVVIWDVTNYVGPRLVGTTVQGGLASFKASADQLHEYVAFYPDASLPQPEKVADLANQDLHMADASEMVIISHPNFLEQAQELANFHQRVDGMSVRVLTPNSIYNEFSGGLPDVAGIRNFLKMCYDRDSGLKYVLLFGDGSYDNKDLLGKGGNFLPTYQSENSLVETGSFVTDDFFVLLDEGEGEYVGLIDFGIGRIPVSSKQEGRLIVRKIEHYADQASLGEWRNVVCFIGDDEDSNEHMKQADGLAQMVDASNPSFYTEKIYFDAYPEISTPGGERYPGVTDAINKQVKKGALILNYTGHAGETALAHEHVLGTNDIDSWSNYNSLPIFVTATCEFSRFDSEDKSGGEHILFNPNGGGIGLFSTTRLVYSSPNFELNKEFYRHVFTQDVNGENLRMGEIMKQTKNGNSSVVNKRNFTLLADPALKLSYPRYKVVTETINGKPVGEQTDVISSLSTVTITGKITDLAGETLSGFDGELIPIVYDKAQTVRTLGNGGEEPMSFKVQNNIIYKGVSSVSKGKFQFSFIVPKDISYSVDKGKIIYYADNGEVDAQGYTDEFSIGGSSGIVIDDQQGPELELYLNNENFRDGDEVGKNPILIANVMDEHGINTVGTGIGHDITAVLDNDYSNVIVLNDFYLSDIDSYQSGQIIYPLSNLSLGEHTLTVKVWDVLNNSTEVEIRFVVTSNLEIKEVFCYPNPVTDFANFVFMHNRPDESFDAKLEVFDISGSLMDVLTQRLGSSGEESLPMLWQVTSSTMLYRTGAYIYRITIVTNDGASASKAGKMIISKY